MIYIRTDMNEKIATGHLIRCLAIADAAREKGEETTFIVADQKPVDLLKKRGYPYIVLQTEWNCMEDEIPKLISWIKELGIEKILIDSYQVTEKYLKEIGLYTRIFYLDDLNAFAYPVDAIICYANYYKQFHYEKYMQQEQLFLGVKYTPLRKVFWNCPSKKIADRVEKLLILSGGSDPYNVAGKLLEVIELADYKEIVVICGPYNENYQQLAVEYKSNQNVHIKQNVDNIEVEMKKADVAISAGGTTLYELCALGVPTISYSFVDNQLDNVKQFQREQLIDYAGDVRYDNIAVNINTILRKYRDAEMLRKTRSEGMQKMIDGKGAERIAEALMAL